MKRYDAIIIGFGKGGKTLAGALAGEGKSVAVIERSDKMYGGTCINVGCIPSKSLIHSAERSAGLGGSFEEKAKRYEAAIQEKRRLVGMLRKKNFDKLNSDPNVEVITGTATFIGEDTVSVSLNEGGAEELKASQIFVNTGSRPFMPPIPGLNEAPLVYTSEELLDLEVLPERLLILGGGYIGVEFASMYANFGAKVTMLEGSRRFLPREDEEIARMVRRRLMSIGVNVLTGTTALSVRAENGKPVVAVEEPKGKEAHYCDAILVAAGRRPNLEDLHPEAAGIELTERGAIHTDTRLRTSNPNIWAMGDVAGGLQFTYISLDDCRIVKSQLWSDGSRTTENRGAVPYSVFLDPPFSRVGLSEQEARERGYEVKIARLPAAAVPKAQVVGKPEGLLKAVIDAKTGHILGAHLFCAESHELINQIKLAMDAGIPYTVLRDAIYTHPTMSEAFNDLFANLE